MAYKHKNNEKEFFNALKEILIIAKDSLEKKRKWLNDNIINKDMLPAFSTYVGTLKNHFSTIGIVGLNEMCENFNGNNILTEEGMEFSIKVCNFIREELINFQEETGNLYNFEATPAESTCYRLAKKDVEDFEDIIVRGVREYPYYTNSCHMPPNEVKNLKQLFDHQDKLQVLFTGGTVVHIYCDGAISGEKAKYIVKTVCKKYRTPYVSISPLNRYCEEHGYVKERVEECPICGKKLDLYQRITGYLRKVEFFNDGKKSEFKDRNQLSL